jgi:selenocysteine lyase/cysteine desulfurase
MSSATRRPTGLGPLVGDAFPVPCVDGKDRPYLNLDSAASTSAFPVVARAVDDFLPWYSSVHRGAGHKSAAIDRCLRGVTDQVAE